LRLKDNWTNIWREGQTGYFPPPTKKKQKKKQQQQQQQQHLYCLRG